MTGTFPLTGTRWIVEEIDGRPVTATPNLQSQRPPVVMFPSSGGISVAGCNRGITSLTHDGGTGLSFTPRWPTTLIGCGPQAVLQDERLNAAVSETTTYRHQGDRLWFLDRRGVERLRLKRTNEAVE